MASSVTISRYRPALCVLAALAAGYTIYYVHSTQRASEATRDAPLRRQTANNRRRPRPPQIEERIQAAVDNTEDEDNASRSERSWHEDENDDTKKEGAQPLLNMLYHIAEDQSRREGFVHSGIVCQNCRVGPIRGFRYKCINCVDFDLCEVCETMQVHPKTHLFLKIRIPTPAHAIARRPQIPWYPGKTIGLPNNLKSQHNKLLSDESGFTEYKIDALWEQFKTLAATPWPQDPLGFCWAIDQATFHKSFSLNMSSVTQKAPVSLVYDRIFRLHDSNKDGLIGFEEFVHGMAILSSRNLGKRREKTFEGFDFDEDGFISRKDVLAVFKACYALSQELARGLFAEYELDLMEGGNLLENIEGTQPLSAAFRGSYGNEANHQFTSQGKIRDANGDLIVSDSGGVVSLDDDDDHDLMELVCDLKEIAVHGDLKDSNYEASDRTNSFSDTSGHGESNENEEPAAEAVSGQQEDTDVGDDLGQQLLGQTDDTRRDRGWVLFEGADYDGSSQTSIDRETTRQDAVEDRTLRRQFYNDEEHDSPVTIEGTVEEHSGQSSQCTGQGDFDNTPMNTNQARLSSSSSKDMARPTSARIPPPMSEDVGQEILFQITQECINELIDPLFRPREDLALCLKHFSKYFSHCEQHLEVIISPIMERDLTAESAKQAMKKLSSFELQQYLKVRAAGPKVYGHGDNHPLIGHLETLNDRNSLNCLEVIAEELRIVYSLKDSQEKADETQATPSLGSDTSQPEESESEDPMTTELHETVRLFDQNDNTTLEEDISKQNLDSLLEESGYSIIPDIVTSYPDPTLPQNRPDSDSAPSYKSLLGQQTTERLASPAGDDRVKLPKPFNSEDDQYVPPVSASWSHEFISFLRFLRVLQRAQEDDQIRGGPGKIDFKEFSDIVTGSAAHDLEFLGQWIDM